MNKWVRFDEVLLPNIEDCYSSLNMGHITDADYEHAKKKYLKNLK